MVANRPLIPNGYRRLAGKADKTSGCSRGRMAAYKFGEFGRRFGGGGGGQIGLFPVHGYVWLGSMCTTVYSLEKHLPPTPLRKHAESQENDCQIGFRA